MNRLEPIDFGWHNMIQVKLTETGNNKENIMKSSTKDKAEGKLHQIKGTIKEVAGIIAGNDDLEAKGKEENLEGKIQEKIGQIKKVVNK